MNKGLLKLRAAGKFMLARLHYALIIGGTVLTFSSLAARDINENYVKKDIMNSDAFITRQQEDLDAYAEAFKNRQITLDQYNALVNKATTQEYAERILQEPEFETILKEESQPFTIASFVGLGLFVAGGAYLSIDGLSGFPSEKLKQSAKEDLATVRMIEFDEL